MTEVRSNMFGKYSENDVRTIREENRILEMRWEVFEGLYDRTRQELEKVQYAIGENIQLRMRINELEANEQNASRYINERDCEIEDLHKLLDEAILENEKLQAQITLYVEPLKSLENALTERQDVQEITGE